MIGSPITAYEAKQVLLKLTLGEYNSLRIWLGCFDDYVDRAKAFWSWLKSEAFR